MAGYGKRNPHCVRCGDERGGPIGHEISECLYRPGMTNGELAETMPPEKRGPFWAQKVEEYLDSVLPACAKCGKPADPDSGHTYALSPDHTTWAHVYCPPA